MTRVADDKRKKKRAARSRTGCLTCRERRVKCDETKPICQRCLTVGRPCRGYDGYAVVVPAKSQSAADAVSTGSSEQERHESWSPISSASPEPKQETSSPVAYETSFAKEPYPWTAERAAPQQSEFPTSAIVVRQQQHTMQPLVVQRQTDSQSPVPGWKDFTCDTIYYAPRIFDSDSQRAISFFNERTVPEIGSFLSRGLWAQVPKIAYNEPTIRHAVIALSNLHEQFSTRLVPTKSALRYYMMAIQELRAGIPTVTGILCLMMFFAIELLQKSHSSAMQLFRVARRMMSDIKSDQSELYHSLRHLIRRLDKQVTEICGDIDPSLTYKELWGEEPFKARGLVLAKSNFHTYKDALDAMVSIIEPWLNDPAPDCQAYLDKIQGWLVPFEEFKSSPDLDELSISKIPTLEVFWRHYFLLLSKARDAPISQTWWDQHETCLGEIVHFLQIDPDIQNGVRFGLEHCLVYHLFNIGRECRSPAVRKKILDWLQSLNMQEGILTVELVSKVLNKVIALEEAGLHIQSSAQIPEHRRIQEVSLDVNEDTKKMKYKINGEWRAVSLKGV